MSARNRAYRERLKCGRSIFAVEADHVALTEALIAAKLLAPELIEDHDAVTRSIEALLKMFSSEERTS